MRAASLTVAFSTLLLSGLTPLEAQVGAPPPKGPELLMHPQYDKGQPVSPIFEGWYQNPDGSYTLSFGFFNRNLEEQLEIPLGPDNFIEPAQFNGDQPTTFPTYPDQGFKGRGTGVFSVVVPADFSPADEVVWTLRSKGVTHSVPGRIGRVEYRLADVDDPVGNGSMPPRMRFERTGLEMVGLVGLTAANTLRTSVGVPVTLTVWAADNFEAGRREPSPITLEWVKHQGPPEGTVTFAYQQVEAAEGDDEDDTRFEAPAEGGEVSTIATFDYPGEYLLRVTGGNFGARDSNFSNQCCWTNGYVRVTVTP